MARQARTTGSIKKHLTKAEKETRQEIENIITEDIPLEPPADLTEPRQAIYSFIVSTLNDSGIIKKLDLEVIKQACITIDRLHQVDQLIDTEGLTNSKLLTAKNQLFSQFLKVADLLMMSPQSRAKLGAVNVRSKEKDPLITLLEDMDGGLND